MNSFRRFVVRNRFLPLALLVVSCSHLALGNPPDFDTAKIESLTGLKGTYSEQEGVFKVTSPRSDLKVSVDSWTMPPFMGLTSWAAFQKDVQGGLMVMGDLVL